jgi:hypothetical protein
MSMEMDQGQGELTSMTGTMSSVHDEDEAPLPVLVDASRSGVLVQNTAAPLDLVAVLDVSESMAGTKLAQVKRATEFVIDSLGPRDRLSVA